MFFNLRYFLNDEFKESSNAIGFVDPDVVQLVKLCSGKCQLDTINFHTFI